MSALGTLRTLRQLKGLSQQELAVRVHTSQGKISRYETGELPIPPRLLPAWCAALDISPAALQQTVAGGAPELVHALAVLQLLTLVREAQAALRPPTDA